MLSEQTINRIKSTVPVLQAKGKDITARFYEMMFQKHPSLLNLFNHSNQKQGRQQAALAHTLYAAAANIENLEAVLPVVRQIGEKHRSLGVLPEHYPIVGEHLLLAMKDVLKEAATEEILTAWGEAYEVIAGIFISVEKEMYEKAESQSGGWKGFREFLVDRVEQESGDMASYYLIPADSGPLARFLPGQYISIKFSLPDEEYTHIRQYSLSDCPDQPYYRITVKKALGEHPGKISHYLHNAVKKGNRLLVSAPAGDFYLDRESETPVVLLSGGSGITPMLSMLNDLTARQKERQVLFIHAAEASQYHPFKKHIETLAAQNDSLKTWNVYAHPLDSDTLGKTYDKEGYIDQAWLESLGIAPESHVYFCGSVPFMRTVFQALKALGMREEQLHFEFFGPAAELNPLETTVTE